MFQPNEVVIETDDGICIPYGKYAGNYRNF